MKKFFCFIYLTCQMLPTSAQGILSLDSCRALAVANNKELLISREKINAAHYRKKRSIYKLSAQDFRYRRIYAQPERVFLIERCTEKCARQCRNAGKRRAAKRNPGNDDPIPATGTEPAIHGTCAIIGQYRHCHPAQRIGTIARRCFPHRHTQYVCRGVDADPAPLYGRQDTRLQQNNQICRRAGTPAAQQRNAGSNSEHRPGILASGVSPTRRNWRKAISNSCKNWKAT